MTATEVRQRTEEQLRLMSPILGRQHNELLRPLIDRVFGICLRRNLLPEAPEALGGRELKVQYVSQIAKAQKASVADSFLRALQNIGPLLEFDPTVMDNIDSDAALIHMAQTFDLPQEIIRDRNEVKQVREQRAEAQQAQAQQEQQMQQAEMINKVK